MKSTSLKLLKDAIARWMIAEPVVVRVVPDSSRAIALVTAKISSRLNNDLSEQTYGVLDMVSVSPEQMQQYVLTAKNRKQQRLVALQQRRVNGLEIAKLSAQILKTEFDASRVVVFGSLLTEHLHETSDIDLAVWGLSEKSYFKAVGRLLSLSDFEFDLVEAEYASPEILAAIAQGTELQQISSKRSTR